MYYMITIRLISIQYDVFQNKYTAIFNDALIFVYEKADPINFLDIFSEYNRKCQDDGGVAEDIKQHKQSTNKKLSLIPMKSKDKYSSNGFNLSTSKMEFQIKDKEKHYSTQSISNINNINKYSTKSIKHQKLDPLSMNLVASSSENLVNLKQSSNFPMKEGEERILPKVQVEQQKTSQLENSNIQANSLQIDSNLKSDQGWINNSVGFMNGFKIPQNYNSSEKKLRDSMRSQLSQSGFLSKTQHNFIQKNKYIQGSNPYSLKSANNILKEHFKMQIEMAIDPRKKWIVKSLANEKNHENSRYQDSQQQKIIVQSVNKNTDLSQVLMKQQKPSQNLANFDVSRLKKNISPRQLSQTHGEEYLLNFNSTTHKINKSNHIDQNSIQPNFFKSTQKYICNSGDNEQSIPIFSLNFNSTLNSRLV